MSYKHKEGKRHQGTKLSGKRKYDLKVTGPQLVLACRPELGDSPPAFACLYPLVPIFKFTCLKSTATVKLP